MKKSNKELKFDINTYAIEKLILKQLINFIAELKHHVEIEQGHTFWTGTAK